MESEIDFEGEPVREGQPPNGRRHEINMELVRLIQLREGRKFYLSIFLVSILFVIIALMMVFQFFQLDITPGWKEILLVLTGVLSVSLSKLIDHWYANDERESDLLESAQD